MNMNITLERIAAATISGFIALVMFFVLATHAFALGVTSHGAATPGGAAGGYTGGTGNWGSGGGGSGGGGNGGGGSGGGGGGNGGGGPSSSPPRACTLTLERPVVQKGINTIRLSWAPTPAGAVTLSRKNTRITVPQRSASFDDTFVARTGTYQYTLAYTGTIDRISRVSGTNFTAFLRENFGMLPAYADHGGPGSDSGDANTGRADGTHRGDGGARDSFSGKSNGPDHQSGSPSSSFSCTATLRVVDALTDCNDGIDGNDLEDSLVDSQDPGCRDPNSTTEDNPPANLTSGVSYTGSLVAQAILQVRGTIQNVTTISATTLSNRLIGWRKIGEAACSSGHSSSCFVHNGTAYRSLYSGTGTYAANDLWFRNTSFIPRTAGTYEICTLADTVNSLFESNEADNTACLMLTIAASNVAYPAPVMSEGAREDSPPAITGPLSITAVPNIVRRGVSSTLSWDTGGRIWCTITGSNTHVIDLVGASSIGSMQTPPIDGKTVYTIACTDDDERDKATIDILPQFQET